MSERTPIPVALLRFDPNSPHSGANETSVTRYKHKGAYPNSRHAIEYRPWLRHFVVTYDARSPEEEARPLWIHESEPKSWEQLPAPVAEKPKPKKKPGKAAKSE